MPRSSTEESGRETANPVFHGVSASIKSLICPQEQDIQQAGLYSKVHEPSLMR